MFWVGSPMNGYKIVPESRIENFQIHRHEIGIAGRFKFPWQISEVLTLDLTLAKFSEFPTLMKIWVTSVDFTVLHFSALYFPNHVHLVFWQDASSKHQRSIPAGTFVQPTLRLSKVGVDWLPVQERNLSYCSFRRMEFVDKMLWFRSIDRRQNQGRI